MTAVPPALAFIVAALLSLFEFQTTNYPQTFFLLRKCGWFYLYGVIYGTLALGAMLGLGALSAKGAITLQGLGMSSPYVQALAIGISFKALLHIRLFTVNTGSGAVPFGVESLVYLFEPYLTRTILLFHFNEMQELIGRRLEKCKVLEEVKNRITEGNVPPHLPKQEMIAFLEDIKQANSVQRVMELYLSLVGLRGFNRVFPES